jgi:hypothetical protein
VGLCWIATTFLAAASGIAAWYFPHDKGRPHSPVKPR